MKDTRFKLCADVRFRVLDGEGVVLRQEEGEVLVINEVGARILQLIESGPSRGEIVNQLFEEFEVERKVLEEDVGFFFQELEGAGIVEPIED